VLLLFPRPTQNQRLMFYKNVVPPPHEYSAAVISQAYLEHGRVFYCHESSSVTNVTVTVEVIEICTITSIRKAVNTPAPCLGQRTVTASWLLLLLFQNLPVCHL
jgi:hypothetical protein